MPRGNRETRFSSMPGVPPHRQRSAKGNTNFVPSAAEAAWARVHATREAAQPKGSTAAPRPAASPARTTGPQARSGRPAHCCGPRPDRDRRRPSAPNGRARRACPAWRSGDAPRRDARARTSNRRPPNRHATPTRTKMRSGAMRLKDGLEACGRRLGGCFHAQVFSPYSFARSVNHRYLSVSKLCDPEQSRNLTRSQKSKCLRGLLRTALISSVRSNRSVQHASSAYRDT